MCTPADGVAGIKRFVLESIVGAGGTHGRNRMMGNSLLECCVFGRRAGRAATEAAKS